MVELVDLPPAERNAGLSQCRLQLSRLVHANLLTEEQEFIGPLRRRPRSAELPGLAEIVAATNALRLDYSEHVQRWSLHAIDADGAGYATAVRALVDALKALVRRKGALLPSAARLLAEPA